MSDCTRMSDPCRDHRTARRASRLVGLVGWLLMIGGPCSIVTAKTWSWNLEAGRQYQITFQRVIRQEAPDVACTETIKCQLVWTIESVDEQRQMRLVQRLSEVKHSLDFPDDVTIAFDSSIEGEVKGDAAAIKKLWEPLLKNERRFILSPHGRRSALPSEPASSAANDSAGSNATISAANNAASPSAEDWLPLSNVMRDLDWGLPSDSLEPGATWSDAVNVSWNGVPESLRFTIQYQYTGPEVEDGVELDQFAITTNWEALASPDANNNLTIERQAGSGQLWFNSEAGHLARLARSQELVVRLRRENNSAQTVRVQTTLNIQFQQLPTAEVSESSE